MYPGLVSKESIGITLGDPSGIGPEIVVRALIRADDALRQRLIIYGDGAILDRAYIQVTGERMPRALGLVDRALLSPDQAVPGRPTQAGGRAQVGYLEAALGAIRGRRIAGLVTAPINKHEARKAGFGFPGHTEFLAERLGVSRYAMMLAGPSMRVVLATVHIPLASVPNALTVDGVSQTIELAVETMERDYAISPVRVGVLGLNPHAGERGLFGDQEQTVITPAIKQSREHLGDRAALSGPLVPDAAFRAATNGAYDVMIAMYHDQGLIPIKLLDFDKAVNITLGLPIVRTSPDHGVAYDIAGQGRADASSFIAALDLAARMVDNRAARADG